MNSELLARWEHRLRPLVIQTLSPKMATHLYSYGRRFFLKRYVEDAPAEAYFPPPAVGRTCWGIPFRSPLFNAAGMFKNGEGYNVVASQGAGAYLAGTTTAFLPHTCRGREGNTLDGIYLPFAPYPSVGGASNALGLPNDGDPCVAQRIAEQPLEHGCPRGASIALSPDYKEEEQLGRLVSGLYTYEAADLDFIEVNYSCPNVGAGSFDRTRFQHFLGYLKAHFLDYRWIDGIRRSRSLPAIVKFSNDTLLADVPYLLDQLFTAGCDGANFGNSSVAYSSYKDALHQDERLLFEYFTSTLRGGFTGRLLKERSLALAAQAAAYVKAGPPSQEFHIIRTGGVESAEDLIASDSAGISLNEWFTGHWDAFARHGHGLYRAVYEQYAALREREFGEEKNEPFPEGCHEKFS